MVVILAAGAVPLAQSSSWLDRALAKWNSGGSAIPAPPASAETRSALVRRCSSSVGTGSAADTLIAKAGWTPFLHTDRRITRDDVEVVGGMAAAGPGCEPTIFNLFVFVGGRFAGTLSPASMSTARDGAAGSVRLIGQDALTSEFGRYTDADSACCPSSIVRVTYRLNRAGSTPVLAAVDVKRVR
jgi:hypothetical protein